MDRKRTYDNWLHVQPATALMPTATPSAPVSTDKPSQSEVVVQGAAIEVTVSNSPETVTSAPTEPEADDGTAVIDDEAATSVPVPAAAANPEPVKPTAVSNPEPAVVVAKPVQPAPVVVAVPVVPLPAITIPASSGASLDNPAKKDVAMQLVSSAENSSLDWKGQYGYLEDIGDGRGYTGGIIGFTSGTHDMLELVQYYAKLKSGNPLEKFIPALQKVDGSESHAGLGSAFETAWKVAASDPLFLKAQNDERDRVYFNPAVSQAKSDGLHALGQFIYYDAMVMHGPGNDAVSFGGIRAAALKKAKSPVQGGTETAYLNAFLDARATAMRAEAAHEDVDRVETAQRQFLKAGNLDLNTPLSWTMYGEAFKIQ